MGQRVDQPADQKGAYCLRVAAGYIPGKWLSRTEGSCKGVTDVIASKPLPVSGADATIDASLQTGKWRLREAPQALWLRPQGRTDTELTCRACAHDGKILINTLHVLTVTEVSE